MTFALPSHRSRVEGHLLNAALAGDARLKIFYLLLKVPGFVGLVESGIEPDKAAVTQSQHTNDEESVSAPSQDEMSSLRRRDSPFDCVPHGRLLRALLAGEGLKGKE